MTSKSFKRLALSILVSQLAGVIGAVATTPAIPAWYMTITKPALAPPNWIFGPVWTTLFLLIGIAAWMVWEKGIVRKDVKGALKLFGLQLVLNTTWSLIFFGLQNPGLAFLEIIVLWLAIAATIRAFYSVSRPAAYLLIPYILWVSFAGFLNYSIWMLNRAPSAQPIACTQEAKECPDGSFVGRTGPNCEFSACDKE